MKLNILHAALFGVGAANFACFVGCSGGELDDTVEALAGPVPIATTARPPNTFSTVEQPTAGGGSAGAATTTSTAGSGGTSTSTTSGGTASGGTASGGTASGGTGGSGSAGTGAL